MIRLLTKNTRYLVGKFFYNITVRKMNIDFIFKIAAIGIIVAVLSLVLSRSGREEQAMMTTLAGLIVVLLMLVRQISELFTTIETLFGF